ncbi:LeuA family protein [Vulgatibacter sp.]|uniref:LeuA family protein n=1 Tax=Vulgatibacter sp. TaxID=1971226 RepID=UPI003568EB8E
MSKSAAFPEKYEELIYDWNRLDVVTPLTTKPIDLFDESLRDGLQSPSVADPDIEQKLQIVQLMADLGIAAADVGLPCAGPRAYADVTAIATYVRDQKLKLRVCAAGRTMAGDMAPIADIQQKTGVPLTAYAFIGSSPIRQYAENWSLDHILKVSAEAIDFCVKENLDVCYVTEDTTRSSPVTLDKLFRNAIDHGASRLCLCDTVGHATPDGVRRLIQWTQALIRGMGANVKIDWHGHNDRGLAVVNTIFALEYGADRIHGTAMGIGERVGNTAIDQLLMNLKLLGVIDWDLTSLVRYVEAVSAATKVPIPVNYPLVGGDAFRTATGVHAAAIIKAKRKGDEWLADRVYSAVPAGEFGRDQLIEIGPMSGMSNVGWWLERHGEPVDEALCRFLLARAKASDRTLGEGEIRSAIAEYRAGSVATGT